MLNGKIIHWVAVTVVLCSKDGVNKGKNQCIDIK